MINRAISFLISENKGAQVGDQKWQESNKKLANRGNILEEEDPQDV